MCARGGAPSDRVAQAVHDAFLQSGLPRTAAGLQGYTRRGTPPAKLWRHAASPAPVTSSCPWPRPPAARFAATWPSSTAATCLSSGTARCSRCLPRGQWNWCDARRWGACGSGAARHACPPGCKLSGCRAASLVPS